MAEHNDLGKRGEDIAAELLAGKGYKIRNRNWRFKYKEVDIICETDELLIVVEVKSRMGDFERPQDSITPKKIRFLLEATEHYIITFDVEKEVRFDVITVNFLRNKTVTEHIEDAFYPTLS